MCPHCTHKCAQFLTSTGVLGKLITFIRGCKKPGWHLVSWHFFNWPSPQIGPEQSATLPPAKHCSLLRGSTASPLAWRPCDKTQKAEDGWLQLRVLPRMKQSHGDCGTVRRTQQPWSWYVQYLLQATTPEKHTQKQTDPKQSSHENSNNFYCTFLFGLEETFF